MATHSSILAWRIPTDRGAWRAIVDGVKKSWDTTERLSTITLNSLLKKKTNSPIKKKSTKDINRQCLEEEI